MNQAKEESCANVEGFRRFGPAGDGPFEVWAKSVEGCVEVHDGGECIINEFARENAHVDCDFEIEAVLAAPREPRRGPRVECSVSD